MYTLKEILEDDSSPPKPIIDNGILLDGTILLIVGPDKAGKTFLTLNFALSIAMGNGFAGFKITKPKKVLYFLAEGGYFPNRERLQNMAEKISPEITENFFIEYPTYLLLNHPEGYNEVYAMIKDSGAEVVIFDPLVRFHDTEENSANMIIQFFIRIRELIQELGISVIIVHHTGKVESRGGRGSSAIMGEYDSCITIHKAQVGYIRLSYNMRHVETPPSNRIRFNSDTYWFERDIGIIELLEKSGGSIPKKDFIKSYDKSEKTTYRHIAKAVAGGLIKDEDGILELVDLE